MSVHQAKEFVGHELADALSIFHLRSSASSPLADFSAQFVNMPIQSQSSITDSVGHLDPKSVHNHRRMRQPETNKWINHEYVSRQYHQPHSANPPAPPQPSLLRWPCFNLSQMQSDGCRILGFS